MLSTLAGLTEEHGFPRLDGEGAYSSATRAHDGHQSRSEDPVKAIPHGGTTRSATMTCTKAHNVRGW